MKESLESLEQFAIEVILNRRKGIRASTLRFILAGFSKLYGGIVALRLALFRHRIKRERHLGCLVISIGNLTVGGTGKTPVVEMFAKALSRGGRRVAILSRGYKSVKPPAAQRFRSKVSGKPIHNPPRVVSDGKSVLLDSKAAGDEPYMLAKNLDDVVVVVDKDRVKAGSHAIREFGVDTILLDDGLQYLRLQHRLDVVLVDRYAPFGNERMLPRGTLREPPKNLKRASYIFITKCDGGSEDELIARIRKYNRTAEIIQCKHNPQYLRNIVTGEDEDLDFLKGKYVATISGIAVPESFENGLRKLGANVELTRRYADHHRYNEEEITTFIDRCVDRDLDMIVTTEKDFVRFPPIRSNDVPIYYLRVEIEILSGHDTWDRCVERICEPRPFIPPQKYF